MWCDSLRATILLASACCLLFFLCPCGAEFACEDRSPDCPQWKLNMKGNCKGQDYGYMRHNCPVTCELCDEARQVFEAEEEEKRKNPTWEDDNSKVIVLDGEIIDDFLESECVTGICLIEFFAPWCGHCQQVAQAYREAAQMLAEASEAGTLPVPVLLAKLDDSDPANAAYKAADPSKWNFTSYPSLYLVGGAPEGGEMRFEKERYWGGKESTEELAHFMTSLASGMNQTEAAMAYNDVEKRQKPGFYKEGGKHASLHVTEIDTDNFVETVLHSSELWVVEYYSDKCPICHSLAPEMIKAAEKIQAEFAGKLRFGAINSRVFHDLAEPYKVTSYPWVTTFYLGKKVEDMAGLGGWETVYNWAKNKAELWKESAVADTSASIPPIPEETKDEETKDEEMEEESKNEEKVEL